MTLHISSQIARKKFTFTEKSGVSSPLTVLGKNFRFFYIICFYNVIEDNSKIVFIVSFQYFTGVLHKASCIPDSTPFSPNPVSATISFFQSAISSQPARSQISIKQIAHLQRINATNNSAQNEMKSEKYYNHYQGHPTKR